MPANLSHLEFQLFKSYINEKCGIDISEDKAYLVETRLSKLLVDSGMNSFDELYYAIRKNNDPHMSEKLIDAITTNETLWFRDKSPWIILEEVLLPRYIDMLRSQVKSKIRIWSAASSTGQEAYSTAMCIDHYLESKGITDITLSQFEIIATDISQTVLEMARKGKYDAISIMRGMEQSYKEKYFTKDGMVWEIKDKIRNAVKFEHFNLQNSFMFLGKYDIIFCRYVLIYFSDEFKKEITSKMFHSMHSKGILFIGASELYNLLEENFDMNHYGNATYYSKRG